MSNLRELPSQLEILSNEMTRGKSTNSMNIRAVILWLVEFQKSNEAEELRSAIYEHEIRKQMEEK